MYISHDTILNFITKGKVFSFITIAKGIKITPDKNKVLSKLLNDLVAENKLFKTQKSEYFIPNEMDEAEGTIKITDRGFGFVDLEDFSVFISKDDMNSAMNGDTVKILYFTELEDSTKHKGSIKEVIKRSRKTFVGTVIRKGKFFNILPLSMKVQGNFRFTSNENLKEGERIYVEIEKIEDSVVYIKYVQSFGNELDTSQDILAEIIDAGVPYKFTDHTVQEAKKIPQIITEIDPARKDYRNEMVVTIDGDDTKDFDDAIEVIKLEDGTYKLNVHIADVTYYVKESSDINKEAVERGTSIYLADRVIPMLPFELSNGICSLNPQVDRYTISLEMWIDKTGQTTKYELHPGLIKSQHRLTYKQVNQYYDKELNFDDKGLETMLNQAHELSKILRKRKEQDGYIDFEIEESKIIINDEGKAIDIVVRDRAFSEMMIEDFMVRANECVAEHFAEKGLPGIYRVHEKPTSEKLAKLDSVLKLLEIKEPVPPEVTPIQYAKLIKRVKEFRFDDFIKIMLLRTMQKAIYSENNIGHFGLASKHYSHFTSPIRRYPDLILHRMIREFFFKKDKTAPSHFEKILPAIAKHSSDTEVTAMELERRVADIKKAEYYEQFVGKKLDGIITTIKKFGFFVEFPNKAGGMVHVSTLLDGKYVVKAADLVLASKNSEYKVGEEVEVVVHKVDKRAGRIELVLSTFYDEYIKQQQEVQSKF